MAVVLALPAEFAGQETPRMQRPNPMAQENVQRGMAQFQQTCAMCHGSGARGTGSGPSLIDSSLVRHDENGNLITQVIQEGRADRGMPAFPTLTAAQVADIVAFLHAKIVVSDSTSAVGPAGGYSLKRLLTGNVQEGKEFFDRTCTQCHSTSGDLAGIAKKYPPAELEARMLSPRVAAQTGTVTLPSGEKVKGRIIHLDAFDVAVMDAGGRYHSWPLRSGVTVELDDPLHQHLELLHTYNDKDIHDLFAYLETLQ
jgi:cytochrome c oxidase cbb3-type subunit 3